MTQEIDTIKLASVLRERRKKRKLNLRAAAEDIRQLGGSISASTLSRIEQGRVPDLEGFLLICRWLGVPPSEFAPSLTAEGEDEPLQGMDTPERIAVHLRADRELDEEAKEAIMTMIRFAYRAARNRELPNEWTKEE